jgi:hypothetical protein
VLNAADRRRDWRPGGSSHMRHLSVLHEPDSILDETSNLVSDFAAGVNRILDHAKFHDPYRAGNLFKTP